MLTVDNPNIFIRDSRVGKALRDGISTPLNLSADAVFIIALDRIEGGLDEVVDTADESGLAVSDEAGDEAAAPSVPQTGDGGRRLRRGGWTAFVPRRRLAAAMVRVQYELRDIPEDITGELIISLADDIRVEVNSRLSNANVVALISALRIEGLYLEYRRVIERTTTTMEVIGGTRARGHSAWMVTTCAAFAALVLYL